MLCVCEDRQTSVTCKMRKAHLSKRFRFNDIGDTMNMVFTISDVRLFVSQYHVCRRDDVICLLLY